MKEEVGTGSLVMTKSTRELIPKDIVVLPAWPVSLIDSPICPSWIDLYQSAITHQEPIESPTLAFFVDAKMVEDSGPSPHYSGKKKTSNDT